MIIGKLDRRIEIQTATDTRDAFGAGVPSYTTTYTVWASIVPAGGQEGTEGEKQTATGIVKFSIRYISGLDEKMRILYDSEYYDIMSIDEPDRKRSLDITAKKKV